MDPAKKASGSGSSPARRNRTGRYRPSASRPGSLKAVNRAGQGLAGSSRSFATPFHIG